MRHPATFPIAWQVARWKRVMPGATGVAALCLVPVILCAPLGTFSVFASWREGSGVVLQLAAISLAIAFGRDTAVRQPEEFWLYQKGFSLADWAIGRWLIDGCFAVAVMIGWVIASVPASSLHGDPIVVRGLLATAILMSSLYLMTSAILFAAGAIGSLRGTEYAVLLLFLAALEPLFTRVMPRVAQLGIRAVLPPMWPALNARSLISTGESIPTVLPSFLHIGAFVAALLAIGTWALTRRKPEEEPG